MHVEADLFGTAAPRFVAEAIYVFAVRFRIEVVITGRDTHGVYDVGIGRVDDLVARTSWKLASW